MLSKNEVLTWLAKYDLQKYPVTVYHELVVKQRAYPGRIAILGAWKTGCLKPGGKGQGYIDRNGRTYSYTARWSASSPVGYSTWHKIAEYEDMVKEKIPINCPLTKPTILIELESIKGFGFIWALFVLHCFYPETYPLFDQHVFRAYRHIVSNESECPQAPPSDWGTYLGYREFFLNQMHAAALPYWKVDRALWAYGKSIKQYKANVQKDNLSVDTAPGNSVFKPPQVSVYNERHGWVSSQTFGGKTKSFNWKIDDGCNIHIMRTFRGANGFVNTRLISRADIERLNDFISSNNWVPLANNVEKLSNKAEKPGVGWFLYEHLGWSIMDSQLASHLGVILTLSGAWEYNGKKIGIEFRRFDKKWCSCVQNYYQNWCDLNQS